MWKIIFVECRPVGGQQEIHRDSNPIAAQGEARFPPPKKMPEDAGW